MKKTKGLITFSQLSKEYFIETGKINDPVYIEAPEKITPSHLKTKEEIIRIYSNQRLKKYREIIESFSIDFESLKIDGEVYIPQHQKINVNWIIDQYTSPVLKSFRSISAKLSKAASENNEIEKKITRKDIMNSPKQPYITHPLRDEIEISFEKLDLAEISIVVEKIFSILRDQLEGEVLISEIHKLRQRSGVLLRDTINTFYNNTLPQLIEELKSTAFVTDNDVLLNDIDRLALMQYYISLLRFAKNRFHKIKEISAELRTEELANISIQQVNSKGKDNPSVLWDDLSDFRSVISEAILIYQEESKYPPEPKSKFEIEFQLALKSE